MPYKCDFCGKTYTGPGSAGHISQHIIREHQPELLDEPYTKYSLSGSNGSGKNSVYKVYATQV